MYKKNISKLYAITVLNLLCTIAQSAHASADYLTLIAGSPFDTTIYYPDSSVPFSDFPSSAAYSPDNQWLAVSDSAGGSQIVIFSVDNSSTGTLTQVFNTYAEGGGPAAVAFSPFLNDTYYLAVANNGSGNVAVFSVEISTGMLTTVTFVDTGTNPTAVAYSPNGAYLAVANQNSGTVTTFSVNSSNGELSYPPNNYQLTIPNPGEPYATMYSPDSRYLAVTDIANKIVAIYSVNSDGSITFLQYSNVGHYPQSVAYSPDGKQLAVANQVDSSISIFSVDSSTGLLTENFGSPFFPASLKNPLWVAYSPDSAYLLAPNSGNNTVTAFAVNTASNPQTIIEIPGSPFATGTGTTTENTIAAVYSPNSEWVAAVNQTSNNVSVFATPPPATPGATPFALRLIQKYGGA